MSERVNGDRRPSPDALLKIAAGDERGRLRIFLGAAPGVGKTYEMLSAARVRQREGVDVVIGVVETHGRAETAALMVGLEAIPLRQVDYQGRTLEEMDLDAILLRRPGIVLVDELAHTNAPGSRHPKRYQDVQELLEAGIDVYTTLNIQHVESLNDVVARITRIRVRETVPDSVIDRADDIELVDLTPADLIQRLHDGKVYVPAQARRAVEHYFRIGNLTALRELALRRTAQRVDDQMVDYMRSHAIEGPWPAGERVLVCVGGDAPSDGLVRQARRLADRFRAPWTAINVETPGQLRDDARQQAWATEALRLAQRLGGEAVVVPGLDIVGAVIEHARTYNATHIMVGKSVTPGWRGIVHRSVAHGLIHRAGGIAIHVIEASDRTPPQPRAAEPVALPPYLISLGLVAASVPVAAVLQQALDITNVSLVLLTAILLGAMRYGTGPSLVACLAASLAYNFFFLPPLYTFTIADPENIVALFFFTVVALIVSNLAARLRGQVLATSQRARTTESLYQFSRKLAVSLTLDDLLWATCHQIATVLKVRSVILLPDGDTLAVRAGFPPEDALEDADLAAARWSWDRNHVAGRGSDTLPGAKWLFLPMRTARGPIGVVGIARDGADPILTPEQQRQLDALTDQSALAIERINLAHDLNQARIQAEADRLRGALLTSISHDLRTPLASILGSATSLRAHGVTLDGETREALLTTVIDETERLNRFIGNLLDMTRLEAGVLRPALSLTVLSDVIGAALQRASGILSGHEIAVDLPPNLPMLDLDMVLFEQVLFNLLDNAAKYAPPGSLIRLQAEQDGDVVRLMVIDEGDGIPPADRTRIFDKFYRSGGGDRRRAGTGLGLAICRGFVEAMGGTIEVTDRGDRPGSIFTLAFPVPVLTPIEQEVTE